MKFVTFASIAVAVNAQDQVLATAATGALNYHWTDGYHCPDFTTAGNKIETIGTSSASNSTFENWAQECAELAYGLSAEYAPCIQTMYIPGGYGGGNSPYYGCGAYKGTYLVEKDLLGPDIQNLKNTQGVNINDENNRVAACINDSPKDVAGAYSCSRGPLMISAEYLTLGAAAALSVATMI